MGMETVRLDPHTSIPSAAKGKTFGVLTENKKTSKSRRINEQIKETVSKRGGEDHRLQGCVCTCV